MKRRFFRKRLSPGRSHSDPQERVLAPAKSGFHERNGFGRAPGDEEQLRLREGNPLLEVVLLRAVLDQKADTGEVIHGRFCISFVRRDLADGKKSERMERIARGNFREDRPRIGKAAGQTQPRPVGVQDP